MKVIYSIEIQYKSKYQPLIYISEIPFYPVAGQIIDIKGDRFTVAGVLWMDETNILIIDFVPWRSDGSGQKIINKLIKNGWSDKIPDK